MKKTILLAMMIMVLLFSCTREEPEVIEAAPEPEPEIAVHSLKVGLMSAVDAVPFFYALEQGFFEAEEVEVELILFTNAQNRQTALQTGQVDGAMTDLVALITNVGGDFDITGTLSTDGIFPLLTGVSMFEKDRVSAGVMEISVTNYILEEYLLGSHAVDKVFINEIPARLEAILSSQLDTGIFPEPFASIGEMRGLEKVIYHDIPRESLNLIAFTGKALDEKHEAVRRFHTAYQNAVVQMNSVPGADRDTMMQALPNLPPDIRDTVHMPEYLAPRLPSDDFVNEIISWTEGITRTSYGITPDDILDRSFTRGR